jgi:hypothetical protein
MVFIWKAPDTKPRRVCERPKNCETKPTVKQGLSPVRPKESWGYVMYVKYGNRRVIPLNANTWMNEYVEVYVGMYVYVCIYVCMCVCVCVTESEREGGWMGDSRPTL